MSKLGTEIVRHRPMISLPCLGVTDRMGRLSGAGGATGSDGSERPRLAVVYDITSSSPMGLAGLLSEVCELVWVVDLSDPTLGTMGRLLKRLGTVVDMAGTELAEVVELVRAHHVAGVIAFNDKQI